VIGIRPPEFSVIVPSFDRAEFLGDAIASVQEQTIGDFECIVVDDASPIPVNVSSDPRIRLIRREVNGGCSAARNTGLRAARGRYKAPTTAPIGNVRWRVMCRTSSSTR
jgi:glycosyltransferase involved in cell wall biosynthesis